LPGQGTSSSSITGPPPSSTRCSVSSATGACGGIFSRADNTSAQSNPRRGNSPQRTLETHTDRQQRSIGSGGTIKLDTNGEALCRKSRGQHQPRQTRRASRRYVTSNNREERYLTSADVHCFIRADWRWRRHGRGKYNRSHSRTGEIILKQAAQRW